MEYQVGNFVSRQDQIEENVDNINQKCNIVISTLFQALGVKLNGPLPSDGDVISKLLASTDLKQESAKITEIEETSSNSSTGIDHAMLKQIVGPIVELVSDVKRVKHDMNCIKQEFINFTDSVHWSLNNIQQYIKLANLLIHNLTDIPTNTYGRAFSIYVANKLNQMFPNLPD